MASAKSKTSTRGGAGGTGGTGGTGVSTIHCVKCGYNVTGLMSGVCPACETRFAEEGTLPARQLEQPSFLHGLLFLYVATGPAVALAVKVPALVFAAAICAPLAQPTCALLLGVAYGSRWTAGRPRWLRALAGAGLMLALLGVSALAWWLTLRFLDHPISGMARGL